MDWLGAALTFFGLAGPVLALIRQPVVGWGSPQVWVPGLGGLALLAVFVAHERRTPAPMLPLGLFKRRNFAIGNVQTFAMYGGLGSRSSCWCCSCKRWPDTARSTRGSR